MTASLTIREDDSATSAPSQTTEFIIEVTYLPDTNELVARSFPGCADPGATVTWIFFRLPEKQRPRISFPKSANQELGPFLEIRSGATKIQGLSSPSAAGSHLYHLTLEPATRDTEPIDDLAVPDRYLCFGDDEPPPHRNPGG